MKKIFVLLAFFAIFLVKTPAYAQNANPFDQFLEPDAPASQEASASQSAEEQKKIEKIKQEDVTRVDEQTARAENIKKLFANRPVSHLTPLNFIAYYIQYAVKAGVPTNTVILILLLPLLATAIVFFRHVVGVPSLAMLLPIALAITLIATGLIAGLVLLVTIILTSTLARIILKKIRIMQFAKMALTIFIVSTGILATLTISAEAGILAVTQISIFPVLLLILLSQNIVELQIDRGLTDMIMISAITISLGVLGYFLLSYEPVRNFVILYPEIMLLLIPTNIAIGRYFGLRFTEYFRFASITQQNGR
jgi:hypothetical protein